MPYRTIAVSDTAEADPATHRPWAVVKPGQVMFAADFPLYDEQGAPLPLYTDPEARTAPRVRIDSAGFWAGLYGGQWTPPQRLTHDLAGERTPAESAAEYDRIVWLACWTAGNTFITP